MQPQIHIRRATLGDVPAIRDCVARAYEHYIERIGGPPGPMLDDYARVVNEREAYVAEFNAIIVGVLVLGESDEGFLLDNIAVRPEQRRQGLGRRLLELAETRAAMAGYDSIYLYTHQKMAENRALYERIGYIQYDERTEHGATRVFMRKRLR